MRVAEGVDVVIVPAFDAVWHLPAEGDESMNRRTLCGLTGQTWSAKVTRERRPCQVCVGRAPKGLLVRPRKPGPKKRRGVPCKITEPQLRALHVLHWEQRVPINELGRRYSQRFGYKSAPACANTISHHFRKRGWKTHDRIEMTVQASTKHGLARRRHPKSGGKFGNGSKSAGYKRWLANQRAGGETRNPICDQLTARGTPCTHRALDGKSHCHSHDPERRPEIEARLTAMRARSPIHDPARLEPADPLRDLLRDYQANGGQWRSLSRATGIPEHWLSHIASGKQERVDRRRAQLIRDALTAQQAAA